MNLFVAQVERREALGKWIDTLDVAARLRIVAALQKVTKSKAKTIHDLADLLTPKQEKIATQLSPATIKGLTDFDLEFLISRPSLPNAVRLRHKRMCLKMGIDIKVHGAVPNKNEYNRFRYLQLTGAEKPRARMLRLVAKMNNDLKKNVFCKDCASVVTDYAVELELIGEAARRTDLIGKAGLRRRK